MAWDVRERGAIQRGVTEGFRRTPSGEGGYLEAAVEQVLARDYVCDFGLVQPVSDGRRSQSGVQGHDCEIRIRLIPVAPLPRHVSDRYSRGKLYMKQAWAATIHSALVSQKMAMLHLGFWPRAASPLPKHLAAWKASSYESQL